MNITNDYANGVGGFCGALAVARAAKVYEDSGKTDAAGFETWAKEWIAHIGLMGRNFIPPDFETE